jgi:hypothetical protein
MCGKLGTNMRTGQTRENLDGTIQKRGEDQVRKER